MHFDLVRVDEGPDAKDLERGLAYAGTAESRGAVRLPHGVVQSCALVRRRRHPAHEINGHGNVTVTRRDLTGLERQIIVRVVYRVQLDNEPIT
jgi:hypothetical protein